MIEQLMKECRQIAILAGCREEYHVSLTYCFKGRDLTFEASYFGECKSWDEKPEGALLSLKAKLLAKLEVKSKETHSIMERYQEQLSKMESILNQAGTTNVQS